MGCSVLAAEVVVTVTILTEKAAPERVCFGVSPLAELAAALHLLTAVDHARTGWAARTWAAMTSDWRDECTLFAPCWGGYRLRLLFPCAVSLQDDIERELSELAQTQLEVVARFAEYSLTGVDRAPAATGDAEWLRRCARGRAAGPAAELLLEDAAGFLERLSAFLSVSWSSFFAAEWARIRPALRRAAADGVMAIRDRGLAPALASLTQSARVSSEPSRVTFDKLHHGIVDLARTHLLAVPTVFGSPHVLLKHDAGRPAVLQYPIRQAGPVRAPIETSLLRTRCRLLADPTRVQVCRSIARHPRSTLELADALGMSPPEMSRHLRALRDAGLVTTERAGRFVLYTIRHDEVERLGSDLLRALLR